LKQLLLLHEVSEILRNNIYEHTHTPTEKIYKKAQLMLTNPARCI